MRFYLILLIIISSCSNSTDFECESPLHDDLFSFPLEAKCYFELNQSIKCSKAEKKGLICMVETHVNFPGAMRSQDHFLQLIRHEKSILKKFNFVLLYLDDRSMADTSNWVTHEDDTLKRLGEINVFFASSLLTIPNPIFDGSIHAFDEEMKPIASPLTPNSQNFEIETFINLIKQ